jgi:anti-sigma B factor antagonist
MHHYRHLRVRAEGDDTVVRLLPGALGEPHVEEAGEELLRLAAELYRPRLRLDLGGVRYLGSTGLGKLLVLLKRVRAAGGQLAVDNAGPVVYEVFRVTRLTDILAVRPEGPAAQTHHDA